MTPYDIDLDRNPANFQPLTPLTFLERAAAVFSDHTAIIHGPLRRSYAEFYARARQLASSLAPRGIKGGDGQGVTDYEDMLAESDPDLAWKMPDDEWDAIPLNYTPATTGEPKGVVYHHRGAYLLAIGNVLTGSMDKHSVYLWTLAMVHC